MSSNNSEIFDDKKYILHRIKFFILIILEIPAVFISLLIFAFFITHRSVLKNLQNQALLALLLANFIELATSIPMTIVFFYFSYVNPATAVYCTCWTFLAYSLAVIGEFLMATISVQRHTLIFQPQISQVPYKRYIVYHLPLLLCIIYPIVFYIFAIFLYTCDGTQWDFQENGCGFANCYFVYDKTLGTFDWAVNNGFPMVVIFMANVILVIRVVKNKLRRQQLVTWRKHRRMTIQLLSISSLFLIAWSPSLIIALIQQLFAPDFALQIQMDYITELIYLACLLLPLVCVGLLPEFIKWIVKYLHCGATTGNVVRPTTHNIPR
ncbi:unnamed protein product [Adineta ricciae]|uniref:G-protein coupled receptors family 1 profile domain-containing protein n=1 Tax=Adineta ricciae TaxID=249248 RepID=A0A815CU94_ADIRI|nr:unnamed protein product [Adineta ricciae]CAF1288207.1 unnamed protein product [Adineta ricciae]